ncbi:ATP phosphoribosyltransferase regulatory subunit [Alisedimentitalea sp. MJ-SS2]|uniref:ATP phosphoribosyltransferase regulatory subunit n=1 Tax=Aliisedimentitalea sp. MJ-SS2 TaxID=3049795 RepID=UPI002909E5E0|nr:ATP phosphoribosyltransferase regulatory subunit [Alisedimentitalea sp. MJ-SS2]MDU8928505.1 ATP phosphoribosyltransferase regulatory subunit [Alisedimentitalea sp. MJ-SS2]
MPIRAAKRAEAARLKALFEAEGAQAVEAAILLPAETLLDLYGEDIRARAYVTSDALRGEQMLRPDFTVPVVQMHMDHGAEPARYTYAGEVFRRQEDDAARANEYLQVGYEIFDRDNPAAADAEVFALIEGTLKGLPVRAASGDIGILTAAVAGLHTTDRRKEALMRHIWRPKRFRALIERFSGRVEVPPTRQALLAALEPLENLPPAIGLRTRDEIGKRITALHEDAVAAPISKAEVELMEAILSVRQTVPNAVERLRDIAVDMPAISTAVERLADRADAMAVRGVDVDKLEFEASYGRSHMEYYDGFVFGFYAVGRPDLPAVASGGRYDALTRRLGQGDEIPAVGGVVRPGLMLELSEELAKGDGA